MVAIFKMAATLLKLFAKLSAGDVVAQEFKYHPKCLTTV